jgi:threonine synthase
MKSLNDTGRYILDNDTLSAINNDFVGYFTDEYTTMRTVQDIHDNYGYLIDTHTGVAFSALDQYREETGDQTIAIVASTANPYKFAKDVHDAIYDDVYLTDLQAFHRLEKLSGDPIPAPLKDIEKREVKFDRVISPDEMYEEIKRFINK